MRPRELQKPQEIWGILAENLLIVIEQRRLMVIPFFSPLYPSVIPQTEGWWAPGILAIVVAIVMGNPRFLAVGKRRRWRAHRMPVGRSSTGVEL